MENAKTPAAAKRMMLQKLQTAQELYTILSLCSRAPYVVCDEETYDDEIFLYFDEKEASGMAESLRKEKRPANAVRIEKKQLLGFLGNLYSLGVNAILFSDGEKKVRAQLEEIVKRNMKEEQKKVWIENPSLHLTAITFAQELRRPVEERDTEKLAALQEELEADFVKGTLVAAVQKESSGIPLVKLPDGSMNQPLFTDLIEFQKFNREQKFKPIPVPASRLPEILVKEAKGIVLNPQEVSLSLTVKKNTGSSLPENA